MTVTMVLDGRHLSWKAGAGHYAILDKGTGELLDVMILQVGNGEPVVKQQLKLEAKLDPLTDRAFALEHLQRESGDRGSFCLALKKVLAAQYAQFYVESSLPEHRTDAASV